MPTVTRRSRIVGALLGLHAGDSLGATVEFKSHGYIKATYPPGDTRLRDITGGGVFRWPPGHATDDTDMTRAVLLAYLDILTDPAHARAADVAARAGRYFLKWRAGDWPGLCRDARPGPRRRRARPRWQRQPHAVPAHRALPRRGSGGAGGGEPPHQPRHPRRRPVHRRVRRVQRHRRGARAGPPAGSRRRGGHPPVPPPGAGPAAGGRPRGGQGQESVGAWCAQARHAAAPAGARGVWPPAERDAGRLRGLRARVAVRGGGRAAGPEMPRGRAGRRGAHRQGHGHQRGHRGRPTGRA
ncbi:ADP-ribosylglycohydrolase family protein [Cordyceps fumosorosea ARSEF 2679]|uniref:ADP-ribosylglycohydrolase family protein n=1 Tax=Cordyceps fumosorosea (strain ARSEF 2679) TaxID=1081104 RepID=A0A162LJM4_CORFA|nr:ADP-ribosylglycohydrolase family protein [Cordyceps fumosorosea ARSEF 2679]OAA71484.1 ADP-ribosylglycohydrolase family protein [Cordyceps fumosorosea ARSEF 2679]